MDAHTILSSLGASLYLHVKLAERAAYAQEAALKFAQLGVFNSIKNENGNARKDN